MRATASFLAGLAGVAAGLAADVTGAVVAPLQVPAYTASSIISAASALPDAIAPNTIISVYGEHLSAVTRALSATDIRDGRMPSLLPQTGVRVLLDGVPAPLYFVSPRQINVLAPPDLMPGRVTLQVTRDGAAGPEIKLKVEAAAPALFQADETTPVAVAADGALITGQRPARAGEIVILFATGLGPVMPTPSGGEIPRQAAWLCLPKRFTVLCGDAVLPAGDLLYAGLAPGFPGLYQINFRLPAAARGPRLSIRVGYDDRFSQEGLALPVGR